jgi:hypothetical protein
MIDIIPFQFGLYSRHLSLSVFGLLILVDLAKTNSTEKRMIDNVTLQDYMTMQIENNLWRRAFFSYLLLNQRLDRRILQSNNLFHFVWCRSKRYQRKISNSFFTCFLLSIWFENLYVYNDWKNTELTVDL